MKRNVFFSVMAFLIILMVSQALSGMSEDAHYARLMCMGTLLALTLISVLFLAALAVKQILGYLDDVSYGPNSADVTTICEDMLLWRGHVAHLTGRPSSEIPEHLPSRKRLARLLECRRIVEAECVNLHDRSERIEACMTHLPNADNWTEEELRIQLLSHGPYEDFLLEVWRLEAESLEECGQLRHAPPETLPYKAELTPSVLAI